MIKLKSILEQEQPSKPIVIFVAGLELDGHPNTQQQTNLCKSSMPGFDVQGYSWQNAKSGIQIPENVAAVILFSKGCKYWKQFAKDNLTFCIEPWNKDNCCASNYIGVPAENMFIGPTPGRGKGINTSNPINESGNVLEKHFAAVSSNCKTIAARISK